jgi:Rhodopirellula transposase DDE domain
MSQAHVIEWLRQKFAHIAPDLDERGRRRWAASEALSLGRGGISAVAVATGISDRTIRNGIIELHDPHPLPADRQRRPGGGRKSRQDEQPGLVAALERLVEPDSRGDPQSPLRWTCNSTRSLAGALQAEGFEVSSVTVGQLLKSSGFSLQANRKTREGARHPDRNAQFEHIARRVRARQRCGEPALSVDTKKKEVLGNLKNPGQRYRRKRHPVAVKCHDFPDPELGKAIPYGVYDLNHNEAGVSVGITHDTAEFAVGAIRRWWHLLGKTRYRSPRRLLITADSGGSNSSRNRLWKLELQKLADETRMIMEVCHFPPGTSKWNKIEHRVFCQITRHWRGVPLETLEIVVQLIGSTRTDTGLEVHCWLDEDQYDKGRKVTDAEMEELFIKRNAFHGEWNYEIHPRKQGSIR